MSNTTCHIENLYSDTRKNLGLEFWIAGLTRKLCTQIFSHKGLWEICPRCGLSHRFLLFLSLCQHSFELLFRSGPGSLILFSLFLFFSISRYSFSTTLAVTSLTRSSVSSLPMRPYSFPVTNEELFLSLIPAQLWEFCLYEGISHFVVLTCLAIPSPHPEKKIFRSN